MHNTSRGATGSKEPPMHMRTLVSLLLGAVPRETWFRSETPFPPMPLPRWALLGHTRATGGVDQGRFWHPAMWKHGWSKHGSSRIRWIQTWTIEILWYRVFEGNYYARTMFTPTMFSRARDTEAASAPPCPGASSRDVQSLVRGIQRAIGFLWCSTGSPWFHRDSVALGVASRGCSHAFGSGAVRSSLGSLRSRPEE